MSGALLMLPDTNPTPALAASLRHTLTAERQNRVVALRKVNILAAAPTDRHAGGASRTAGIIEQPVFGRGFLQLFHFTAGLYPKPAFPSRWHGPRINRRRPPRSMGGGDLACGAICAAPDGSPRLTFESSPSGPGVGGRRPLGAYCRVRAHLAPGEVGAAFQPRCSGAAERPAMLASGLNGRLTRLRMSWWAPVMAASIGVAIVIAANAWRVARGARE
jgi:hypothetical protein